VLHITTDAHAGMELARNSEKKKQQSLKQHLLEKMKAWINSLLEGERDEFLGRDRNVALDDGHDNYRNGYRPRRINFFGLGKIELKVPRDRKGEFESQWLPERKGQDPELEAFLAEAFLRDFRPETWRGFRRSTWGISTTPSRFRASWGEPPRNWKPGGVVRCKASAISFFMWTGPTF
jgi:mutator family transposase